VTATVFAAVAWIAVLEPVERSRLRGWLTARAAPVRRAS
jgi:hypothetical protein